MVTCYDSNKTEMAFLLSHNTLSDRVNVHKHMVSESKSKSLKVRYQYENGA
jgi:hypothetical protein